MGIFYDRSEQIENKKTFLVMKAKPLTHIFFIFLLLMLMTFSELIRFEVIEKSKSSSNIIISCGILLLIMLMILMIESRGSTSARFKGKQIIKKGGLTINPSNPTEVWIER